MNQVDRSLSSSAAVCYEPHLLDWSSGHAGSGASRPPRSNPGFLIFSYGKLLGPDHLLAEGPLDFTQVGLDHDRTIGTRRWWVDLLVISKQQRRVLQDVPGEHGYDAIG